MISATLATPGLLKIKVLWNKEYDVITYIHDLTKKLSCGSNYMKDIVM